MSRTKEQDHRIMSILNVTEISRVICDTNMGTLKLRIRKGETAYKFVLDAVELPKELNNELMEAIYPVITTDIPRLSKEDYEKLYKIVDNGTTTVYVDTDKIKKSTYPSLLNNKPKGRGRPAGAKNKAK